MGAKGIPARYTTKEFIFVCQGLAVSLAALYTDYHYLDGNFFLPLGFFTVGFGAFVVLTVLDIA